MKRRDARIWGSVLAPILFVCFYAVVSIAKNTERPPRSPNPGLHVFTLVVNKTERSYIVHIPPSYNPKTPSPVVIMFHGGGGTARGAMWETAWTEKADKEGFFAVFPEGTRADPSRPARFSNNPQNWNDGSSRTNVGAVDRNVDDVEFVRRMIDSLCAEFAVDKRQVYATGFSNGASMTFRVGRELPQVIAAIAPVAGSDWLEQERIDRPVSMLYITGTEDPLNPIEGGEIRIGRMKFGKKPPVREMIQRWVSLLGCPVKSHVIYDKDGAIGIAYDPCKSGSEVALYTIEQLGHTWPGGKSLLPESLVGKTSDRIKATDLIWKFFQKHRL